MTQLLGKSALFWSSTSDGDHTVLMRAPLRTGRPAVRLQRFVRESMDFSVREVTTVSTGVHELVGVLRYEDAPQNVADMVMAGLSGTTLTWIPDMQDQNRSWDVYLIDAQPTAQMDADRGFPGFEEISWEVRFRKTDGTPFE